MMEEYLLTLKQLKDTYNTNRHLEEYDAWSDKRTMNKEYAHSENNRFSKSSAHRKTYTVI